MVRAMPASGPLLSAAGAASPSDGAGACTGTGHGRVSSRTCLISDVSHLGRVGDVSGDGVGDVSGTCLISPLRRR